MSMWVIQAKDGKFLSSNFRKGVWTFDRSIRQCYWSFSAAEECARQVGGRAVDANSIHI